MELVLGIHFNVSGEYENIIEQANGLLDEMRTILELEKKFDERVKSVFVGVSHVSLTKNVYGTQNE